MRVKEGGVRTCSSSRTNSHPDLVDECHCPELVRPEVMVILGVIHTVTHFVTNNRSPLIRVLSQLNVLRVLLRQTEVTRVTIDFDREGIIHDFDSVPSDV